MSSLMEVTDTNTDTTSTYTNTNTSYRVIVTDPGDEIFVTTYRDGDRLARVEQSPLQCLMLAERLLDAALRRLVSDNLVRRRFL